MKQGENIEVRFTCKLPVDADYDQVQEWINFELKYSGSIAVENPLSNHELEARGFGPDFE